ncbi:hypothetical protein LOZ51_006782 [Ophidiomyces ophidiicola]|nr:hypothetical protein LOZ54_006540 [Ophidiomyces ophidiicola]KAI1983914.1 hypothetical protein LOZ51_006782 [Ophidiomyces ophidiicola]
MSALSCHNTSSLLNTESLKSDEVSPPQESFVSVSDNNLWIVCRQYQNFRIVPQHPSNFLSNNEYANTQQSLSYLISLTTHSASDNGINPALLIRYSTIDQDNFHGMSKSDQSDMLVTPSESEFNTQSNSDGKKLFCDDSTISVAHAAQDQLLTNFLTHDISDILNISEHNDGAASSSADKQHKSGIEQASASKKLIITEQAFETLPTTPSSNQVLQLKISNLKEGDLTNVPAKQSVTNSKLT